MKILFSKNSEYKDGHHVNLDFSQFENGKNKPAAFKNPLWAKASDWVMFKDIIIGKIKF
jgi:hypothetical protein